MMVGLAWPLWVVRHIRKDRAPMACSAMSLLIGMFHPQVCFSNYQETKASCSEPTEVRRESYLSGWELWGRMAVRTLQCPF